MVGSMFAAVAGLKAHQTRMDVIGNNIANVNTWGYKSQSANFMDATYRNRIAGSAGTDVRGGTNTSQIGYGANISSISVNHSTGNWNPTGWGSDCMVNGPGFFVVSKTAVPEGSLDPKLTSASGVNLSRVGILGIDGMGRLIDDQGSFVLGYQAAADGKIDSTGNIGMISAAHPGETYSALTIQADGTITGVVAKKGTDAGAPEIGSTVTIGMLAVAAVQNPNGLDKTQGYYYNIGANAGETTAGASNAATGSILGGYLEMSNTDLSTEMVSMISTQRGFQANTKIITVTDQMLEEMVNMKR